MSEREERPSGPVIEMTGVSKRYQKGGATLVILDGMDLTVEAGDFLALMGPSGSGKSTILNLIGGLDVQDSGTVVVAGTDLSGLSTDALSSWRSEHVGYVFQAFNLIPVLTALENVELPLLLAPLSKKQRRQQAEYALELVGLTDRMDHRPKQLSGGQEQRVAIARAMAMDPTILLCDEPTGDLDRVSADQIMDILARLPREVGTTIVMVTHDPRASARASRILHLDKGVLTRGDAAPVA
jgi:putative ABC transport system ATP-binding protein